MSECCGDLLQASEKGHVECIEALHRCGADINARAKGGWTAMMYASQSGRMECIEALHRCGADVNARENDGWTAIMYASRNGHVECVEALHRCGADVDARSNLGYTALSYIPWPRLAPNQLAIAARLLITEHSVLKTRSDWGGTIFDKLKPSVPPHAQTCAVAMKNYFLAPARRDKFLLFGLGRHKRAGEASAVRLLYVDDVMGVIYDFLTAPLE